MRTGYNDKNQVLGEINTVYIEKPIKPNSIKAKIIKPKNIKAKTIKPKSIKAKTIKPKKAIPFKLQISRDKTTYKTNNKILPNEFINLFNYSNKTRNEIIEHLNLMKKVITNNQNNLNEKQQEILNIFNI